MYIQTIYRFTYHKLFFFIIRRGIGARISYLFISDPMVAG